VSFRPERSGVEKSRANWSLVTGYWSLVSGFLAAGFWTVIFNLIFAISIFFHFSSFVFSSRPLRSLWFFLVLWLNPLNHKVLKESSKATKVSFVIFP